MSNNQAKLNQAYQTWLSDVESQKSPKEQKATVRLWFDAFLSSHEADDSEVRADIMVMRNNLLSLFDILGRMDVEPSKSLRS